MMASEKALYSKIWVLYFKISKLSFSSIKESLSFGLPIIITRGCKFADVEKEKIGYFINHNPHEIYNKLISLTNNKNSFDDLYYNCKNFANENFNISSIGPTYKENLKEIISGVQYSSNWLKTNKNIK